MSWRQARSGSSSSARTSSSVHARTMSVQCFSPCWRRIRVRAGPAFLAMILMPMLRNSAPRSWSVSSDSHLSVNSSAVFRVSLRASVFSGCDSSVLRFDVKPVEDAHY